MNTVNLKKHYKNFYGLPLKGLNLDSHPQFEFYFSWVSCLGALNADLSSKLNGHGTHKDPFAMSIWHWHEVFLTPRNVLYLRFVGYEVSW